MAAANYLFISLKGSARPDVIELPEKSDNWVPEVVDRISDKERSGTGSFRVFLNNKEMSPVENVMTEVPSHQL